MYFAYAALGLVKFLLTLCLTSQCEAEVQPKTAHGTETAPLLGNDDAPKKKQKKPGLLALLPTLSTESRVILFQLSLLMALDSFASGIASM